MINLETLLLFLAAALAVNISPGPSIVYVSTMAVARGTRAGVLSALGLSLGILVHVVAAALGLSIVLAASAVAFTIVKVLGAAYLIYLGLRLLVARAPLPVSATNPSARGPVKILLQGALVDLLNPKIAIFFLAFLPQFVVPGSGAMFGQILFLGLIFIATGTAINVVVALAAGHTAEWVGPWHLSWIRRWLTGCILVGLGVRLATLER